MEILLIDLTPTNPKTPRGNARRAGIEPAASRFGAEHSSIDELPALRARYVLFHVPRRHAWICEWELKESQISSHLRVFA